MTIPRLPPRGLRRRYNARERQEAVARVRSGYTQEQVADALNLSAQTVGRWCRDPRNRRKVGRREVIDQLQLDFPFKMRPEYLP